MEIFFFILLGACVGILSGYFGIGGGFVLTPILLLMGLSPIVAIATSLLFTIGTSFSGIIAHFRMKNIEFKTGMVIALSGLVATQLAHPFVMLLKNLNIEEIAIPVFYILLAGYFAYTLLTHKKKEANTEVKTRNTWLAPLLIGLAGGFISTTLGVGGGFIIVPLLISFVGLQPRKAVGTSLFAVLFIVIAGFITYSTSISIDYPFAFTLIAGALIGGQLGAYLTRIFKDAEIKKFLGFLYVFTVINMVLKISGFSMVGLTISLGYIGFLLVVFTLRTIHYFKQKKNEMNTRGEAS
ncbi:putative membrane protein YfcA [Bacillus mesophilus]|uniref:Probable membrane transporter protein n=1 Tax=Bacillus mesophilus TaxID=1808955 RepID=A0A6M0QDQ1_9BACI|nr:sulfite exporter TauE/SafE family protein [Bacillus mesophilus]MBM7660075.1 putative membrane protein YfcA [Bacillus mesophilus]NEY73730.1 sulfite exporter TauE/SafE family protein [Bacillus mesophilus]